MAIVKVIELIAESDKSWEDAVQQAVTEAGKSVRGIRSVWVQDLKANVEKGKVVSFRANCKVSFAVENNKSKKK